jgi:hypothetical protein
MNYLGARGSVVVGALCYKPSAGSRSDEVDFFKFT